MRCVCTIFFAVLYLLSFGLALPLHFRRHANDGSTSYDFQNRGAVEISQDPLGRGGITGSVGLGDSQDMMYTVPVELGDTVVALHLDTGSSDLWVASHACKSTVCRTADGPLYQSSSFNSSGQGVTLQYGDSKTGTFASGLIGKDVATIAGIAMSDQCFAAMNATTNPVLEDGAAGILGLGFPSASVIQAATVNQDSNNPPDSDEFFDAILDDGPVLSRMIMSGRLAQPMFAITLQRDTIEIGGTGVLTIGKLPDGIDNSSLTWVPVRLYSHTEGGILPPTFAPNEIYPLRWEIELDDVYIDGKLMPKSTIPGNGVSSKTVSALIDTGNSLMRGPSDVVQAVLTAVSSQYAATKTATMPCSIPHTMAFKIGGKMFPVDPANFISPYTEDAKTCVASELVSTDPPSVGALYSWSLGDPFLKSNLVAFYYGNLTHPSVDPPRIGFLSTVPTNANVRLTDAVEGATQHGGSFQSTSQSAPTASAKIAASVTITPTKAAVTPTVSPSSTGSFTVSSALSVQCNGVWVVIICIVLLLLR